MPEERSRPLQPPPPPPPPEAAPPTRVEWRELYAAADAFKALAPWEWMGESMMFAVRNPKDGETGYCCVMGSMGQFMALGVYPGAEGYATFVAIHTADLRRPDPELRFAQRCLMASFEDREDQGPEDRKILKELGLKYRGAGNWPLFRDHTPGLMPWFVTGAQARFLTLALLAGAEVGKRALRDDSLFDPARRTMPLVFPEPKSDPASWEVGRTRTPPLPGAAKPVPLPADEARLKGILKSARRTAMVLEVDLAHTPMAIHDRGRPYFPLLLLGVDRETDMILCAAVGAFPDPQERLLDDFLKGLESARMLPREVLYRRAEVSALLGLSLEVLGIPMRQAKSLDAIEGARFALEAMACR